MKRTVVDFGQTSSRHQPRVNVWASSRSPFTPGRAVLSFLSQPWTSPCLCIHHPRTDLTWPLLPPFALTFGNDVPHQYHIPSALGSQLSNDPFFPILSHTVLSTFKSQSTTNTSSTHHHPDFLGYSFAWNFHTIAELGDWYSADKLVMSKIYHHLFLVARLYTDTTIPQHSSANISSCGTYKLGKKV